MKEILLLFVLFYFPIVSAQTRMTLDDCIRLAWKQNPTIKNSGIRIKEAQTDYVASIGNFLPRITANAEEGRRFGRSISPTDNSYTTESFDEGTIGLDMTLSLFEGFSRINQVRFRKINRERSEWQLKNDRNELAYQVMDTYYKLMLEEKLLDLAFQQRRLSERYLMQAQTFVELGLKSHSDLQEVKARYEGDVYRYQSRENSLRLAQLQLKQLLNITGDETVIVLDSIADEELPEFPIPEAGQLYAQSALTLPSMKMIELQQQAARKEYAMAGGRFSPSFYARFAIGSNYYNGISMRQLNNNRSRYIGVGISLPLLSGLERLTTLRKQKLTLYRLQNDAELERQRLYTEVEQTVLSLHAGRDAHKQALSHVKAEAWVLKESERKWEEGLISVFQLMEARNRCLSAKAELSRIRLQIAMAWRLEQYYRTGNMSL